MSCYNMTGSGYCYEFNPEFIGQGWKHATSDAWDLEVYGPDGKEEHVGFTWIDGHRHCVFKCSDDVYRARLVVACTTRS